LSSHLVGDLERVCDHVIVLDHGTALVNASVDDLVAPDSDRSSLEDIVLAYLSESVGATRPVAVTESHR
jgi:ABC-type Na+ transport system ATPase subunit NatA